MKIYLASRYSRREELAAYRAELRMFGHEVTSRWLDGKHQISDGGTPIGDDGEALVENGAADHAAQLRTHFAQEDVADVLAADVVVSFTEEPRTIKNRGGRHVEFGIALGLRKRLIVIGHRENLFHWLPDVEFFETWDDFRRAIFDLQQSTGSRRTGGLTHE